VWGLLSLGAGFWALLRGGIYGVLSWAFFTAMALSNYNGDLGTIGMVLGILRLVRL